MSRHTITVTVNGAAVTREIDARTLLVHFLREDLDLTGTHIGCDTTSCGACTVLLDGVAVKSCTLFAVQADGANVETIESLAAGGALHPRQEGFWEKHGLQCGYCTPGMIMSAKHLLAKNPEPTEEEIRRGISGNLCRCTGYNKIVEAVQYAAAKLRGAAAEPAAKPEEVTGMTHVADRRENLSPAPKGASAQVATSDEVTIKTPEKVCGMGHRMKRKEDPRFIRGKGRYLDDVKLPGMLYLDIVRSPYAHAKVGKIDASEALAIPGVLAVITAEDLKKAGNLHWMPTLMSDTQMVLPIEKVVYYAQEVCAVVATSRYLAADAIEKVRVEYEPLPVVVDPFEALKDETIIRDDKEQKTNHIWHWEAGDQAATDKVFAEAATCRASMSPRSRPAAWSRTTTRRASTCRST